MLHNPIRHAKLYPCYCYKSFANELLSKYPAAEKGSSVEAFANQEITPSRPALLLVHSSYVTIQLEPSD